MTEPVILLVDDEPANLLVLKHAFGKEFGLISATSGAAALELLEQYEVSVIVTDIRMPGMNGLELLEIVRERNPNTIRLAVTAYDIEEYTVPLTDGGLVARYLIKPWRTGEMRQLLEWAQNWYKIGIAEKRAAAGQ